jgi:hypothetical protein
MAEGGAVKFSIVTKEPVRVITSSGAVMVDAQRVRELAVHPAVNWVSDDGSTLWTVTHVPTGFRLGSTIGFDQEDNALAFIKALDALPFDWSDSRKLRRNSKMRDAFEAIAALCDAVEMVETPQ